MDSAPTRVAIIGSGFGGLGMAIRLGQAGFRDVTIFEKADTLGGTWRDNTYPGSGCDVPSHLYSFSFAPNPRWTRKFPDQAEILDYLQRTADDYGVRDRIRFGREITEARFDEDDAAWTLTLDDGSTHVADVLVAATGQLNRPHIPDIAGRDDFAGPSFHSARWAHDVDLTGKDVAVIGIGASAIQFVPEIAGQAGSLTLYQRSVNYVGPKPDALIKERTRRLLARVTVAQRLYRASIWMRFESRWFLFRKGSRLARAGRSDESRIDLAALHVGPLHWVLRRGSEPIEVGPFFERANQLLLFRDPPDHTRLRALVNRAFTPRRVRDLEPRIEAIANAAIDGFISDGETELMERFAYPFPAQVICELIGVPTTDAHHIIDHAPGLAGGLDPGPLLTREARDAANVAIVAVVDYLTDLIERRRAEPGDDLLSALLVRHDGDSLTHDELIETILLLLIAGHETTANLLGNGIVALLDQPDALRELRSHPDLDSAAVDELLRFDSPVQMTMRVATDKTTSMAAPSRPAPS